MCAVSRWALSRVPAGWVSALRQPGGVALISLSPTGIQQGRQALSLHVWRGNCSCVPGGCHSDTLPALLVGNGTRGCLCFFYLPWVQAQTCLQLEVSLESGETSPEHAFASSGVSQSLPGSHNLLPLCELEGSVPVSWHEKRMVLTLLWNREPGWLKVLEPVPSLGPSTSSQLQL